ncbi:MAG: PfkB family carbohydrate kinase [Pseudomonadales bacterium]
MIKSRMMSDKHYIAAVGGANIDVHGISYDEPRLHDSNPGRVCTSPGGTARNIAENLARLGIDAHLLTAVGGDHYGDVLLKQGHAAGIDMSAVAQIEAQTTSTYLSVLDSTGNMLVSISDMSILEKLDPETIEQHHRLLEQAAVIVVDTNLSDNTLAYITDQFAAQPIFVDTVSSTKAINIRPYLYAVHTIVPNLIEAEALSGVRGENNQGLENIAQWFHGEGVQRVFITLGNKGIFFSTADQQGTIEPSSVNAATNVNGAGDAFTAAMTVAWVKQWPLDRSLEFAMAAASHTLSDAATVSPTISEAIVLQLCEQ